MKVSAEHLPQFLEQPRNFKPIFFLSGEEPFQIMESADLIRQKAVQLGYTEREIFHVENARFNWGQLAMSSSALSLFSDKKVLDVRLSNAKPSKEGVATLIRYAEHLPDDKVLIIQMGKLDYRAKNTKWVKALDRVGVMIQVWVLSPAKTLNWVAKRLRQFQLNPSQEAVRFLTERVEGNLSAAAQEVDKLQLLYGKGNLSLEQVQYAVSDSSRFNIFDLSTPVMIGDIVRVQHILRYLQQEGAAIPLVLWTLSNLARQLYDACFQLKQGANKAQIIGKIARPQQQHFQTALHRLNRPATNWQAILSLNGKIDRLSKGLEEGGNKGVSRIWTSLLALALLLSGVQILKA
ncbi:MAG: DNA polymerase III subunit delta [Cocleimonas sp.]|nr:DNA polymerase III subunit delta [Cocleimonas sp.]